MFYFIVIFIKNKIMAAEVKQIIVDGKAVKYVEGDEFSDVEEIGAEVHAIYVNKNYYTPTKPRVIKSIFGQNRRSTKKFRA